MAIEDYALAMHDEDGAGNALNCDHFRANGHYLQFYAKCASV